MLRLIPDRPDPALANLKCLCVPCGIGTDGSRYQSVRGIAYRMLTLIKQNLSIAIAPRDHISHLEHHHPLGLARCFALWSLSIARI